MHASVLISLTKPAKAWRHPDAPNTIMHGVAGELTIIQNVAETQQLIAELQREVAAVEALARGVAA